MTPPRDDTALNPGQWIKGNLVGLGSAAVLAVYAAGYARTREAAQRFEGEDRLRHAAAPAATVAILPDVAPPAHAQPRPVVKQPPASPKTPAAKAAKKSSTATATADAKQSAPAADTTPARADTATTPQPTTPAPAAASPAIDTASKSEKTQVGWKDGTFAGWGGSRHGDIQATVEIKAGRIISAWISICATQYSCSWLDSLPGQVVARQSPEVDFVSGATQSTNAFYYAVVQALRKAK